MHRPLPGSTAFHLRPDQRVPRPKTKYYDGIWRAVGIIDAVTALIVLAVGAFLGWDSVAAYLAGFTHAGQVLVVLASLTLVVGLYLRWRGGHHDWQSPPPESLRSRPDLRA
ncbi:MAG: hypothetical protein ABI305_00415, partial [Tepidiformaceae bacterium]